MGTLVAKQFKATLKLERFTGTSLTNDREIVMDFTVSTVDENAWDNLSLANGQSDIQLPFGGLTKAHIIAIKSDEEITVKINDSLNVAIPITEIVLRSTTGITALYLSNASGNTANVEYAIGEKTS